MYKNYTEKLESNKLKKIQLWTEKAKFIKLANARFIIYNNVSALCRCAKIILMLLSLLNNSILNFVLRFD